ncbi:MAG: hypothetical protein IID59_05170, partial [Proteobacteria bacterium]|nr:hypothetical protein [Pseudomonadota bacterium]
MSKPNIVVRTFSWLWRGVDGFRKLLHLAFMLLVLVLFMSVLMQSTPPIIAEGSALEIRPMGYLVEQQEGDPFDRAKMELFGDQPSQTVVQDIVDALEYAKSDDRIEIV